MLKKNLIITGMLATLIAAYLTWQRFIVNKVELPQGETRTETIMIQGEKVNRTREIMVTDGVRHSVPLEEILEGIPGSPKDQIPPIDDPKFTSVNEANEWLEDENPGIAVSVGNTDRFYPYRILVWHEIVNETIEGERVLVTYCPLCFSGVVYDPIVEGERVEFGTSGSLWNSNLVMYDRKTDSLWSQVLGEAIVGKMTGTKLKILPSDLVRFGEWKAQHPSGEVLSRDIDVFPPRDYNRDPYGNYYTEEDVFFPVNAESDRLKRKDFILGIVIDGKAKAYFPEAIKGKGEIEDIFQGKAITARYEEALGAVRIFEKKADGTEERINTITSFWFAWVAAYPDTELYN
jgi:hypothetical protein